jgi:hypothetical protein
MDVCKPRLESFRIICPRLSAKCKCIRLDSGAIVIYTSYHSTNRFDICHDSPLPKTKESYHPFKKKLFTTLQKTASKHFFLATVARKNWVTFTLRNERLDLKITR